MEFQLVTSTAERRRLPQSLLAVSAAGMIPRMSVEPAAVLTRVIPAGTESIPAVGFGTWQTLSSTSPNRSKALIGRFHALGGRLIDTSPMYGDAEAEIGRATAELGLTDGTFMATKLWTSGRASGEAQFAHSRQLLGRPILDLEQVHNLSDWQTQLAMLRERRAAGAVRYIGITHYLASAHVDLEKVMRSERVDFVQMNYNIAAREADKRLLPAAMDLGVAVIVNRPFEEGALFQRVKRAPLPDFAAELSCRSWCQYFLKFILAHPAVTCVIPATGDLKHLEDNMAAGTGPLPDPAQRQRMLRHFLDM
jgi:diketogulonate reductase-like aldo/keto reductase